MLHKNFMKVFYPNIYKTTSHTGILMRLLMLFMNQFVESK